MHQAEALWIRFRSAYGYSLDCPFAIKAATGRTCALSGHVWVNYLNRDPQDYAIVPDQPWLDGYWFEKGVICLLVAMPLGEGYTVEEQLTGAAMHGGVQICANPIKRERYESLLRRQLVMHECRSPVAESPGMGLAPGRRMKQEVYDDHYGLDAWDQRHASRCFVTLVNSAQWMAITGEPPPHSPPTARTYTEMGLPWFDYFGGDAEAVAGAEKFRTLTNVAQIAQKKGTAPLPDNESIDVSSAIRLVACGLSQVREGVFAEVADQ